MEEVISYVTIDKVHWKTKERAELHETRVLRFRELLSTKVPHQVRVTLFPEQSTFAYLVIVENEEDAEILATFLNRPYEEVIECIQRCGYNVPLVLHKATGQIYSLEDAQESITYEITEYSKLLQAAEEAQEWIQNLQNT